MRVRLEPDVVMRLWLARIIDDLDPEDFSVSELINEFGAAEGSMGDTTTDYNGENHIRAKFAMLIDNKLVEKIARGRYKVTEAGLKFREDSKEDEGQE